MITHKDRSICFDYDWFERLLHSFNVNIIVVNNESLSPQEELVQDMISILHIFSCRIYGLRKYKKKIKEEENVEKTKVLQAIGVSRYIYNFYIAHNKEIYEK